MSELEVDGSRGRREQSVQSNNEEPTALCALRGFGGGRDRWYDVWYKSSRNEPLEV